ncbi:ABC transporter ATP-binding protein [Halobacteriovorax sp. GB3]|uniref:ABC transporter ATP-binding protein n=1 Tax=Halobacteriovorax sp. GB3 TaxID=2719615 RepID=UPI0023616816|nr:ABC transporter ATP-binding protein [Halobacteriovorax sp. GB3]MDD0851566.1 ABC transporter ATP-binding protein [Halobacteriovorax sp. GB3]
MAITIEHISKEYPGRRALVDVNFSVKRGRIHGFLGPNGAGKSTTMKIITGVLRPNGGSVKIMEGARIGYLPETPPLYGNMTVINYLNFVQQLYTLKVKKNLRPIDEILNKCGLIDVKSRLIRNLSKGYKQRVGIASTLVSNPEIIILDEPTVGLDPKAILEIRDLIKELSREHTVLLSTHQLHEANLLCEDITIINKGEILMTGAVEEIRSKISGTQQLEIEVEGLKEESLSKLEASCSVEISNRIESDRSIKLTLKAKEGGDHRAKISQFFSSEGAIVISLSERTLDLEGIFKEVTGVRHA